MMCNRKRMPEAPGGREEERCVWGEGAEGGVMIVRESGSCCPHGGRNSD